MKKLFLGLLIFIPILLIGQEKTINGTVSDQEGEPLAGVNIIKRGSSTGTISGEMGNFSLTLANEKEEEVSLVFSYIGYETEVVSVMVGENVQTNDLLIGMTPKVYQIDVCSVVPALSAAPFQTTIINQASLKEVEYGQDMPFLLRWTPSAVATSDGGTGIGYTGLRLRGSDATRTNVTINGVPLNDAESQGVYWVDIPDFVSSTQQISIQRGVGNSTNGAGAFGAGVHLSTFSESKASQAKIETSIGSFNTIKNSIALHTGKIDDLFSFHGRLSRIRSDGFIDRASSNLLSYYLAGNYQMGQTTIDALAFGGKERTYQAWFGVPAQFVEDPDQRTHNPAGEKRDGTFHENQEDVYTQLHYQLHIRQQIASGLKGHIGLHYTRGFGYFEEYKDEALEAANFSPEANLIFYGLSPFSVNDSVINTTDLVRRRWLDNHFYGVIFKLGYDQISNLSVTLGGAVNAYDGRHFGELIWARFASNAAPDYRYYDVAARKTDGNTYLQTQLKLDRHWSVFADLQYRMVDHQITNPDTDEEISAQYSFFNPKMGVSFLPDFNTKVFLSVAVANREPSRQDFLNTNRNKLPKPERLLDWEAGIERKWTDKGLLQLTSFYMKYTDQLALTGAVNQDALPVRVNIPNSYRYGLELDVKRQFGNLGVGVTTAVSQNKISSFTEFIDNWDTGQQESIQHENTDLAFSPGFIAGAVLQYDIWPSQTKHKLMLQWNSKYVGKQYLDNTSNEASALPAFTFSHFGVLYSLASKRQGRLSIEFQVRNIFDAQYVSNGWTYRYIAGFDGRPGNPYTQLEEGDRYNLTGFFPQAGRHYMAKVVLEFE